jgi:hypothetical protein
MRALEKDHWHRETVDVVDGGAPACLAIGGEGTVRETS